MPSDEHADEILRRLIGIDHKTDSMEDSLAWIVRANAPHLKDELLDAFGNSKRRVQVYLALDGRRTVQDVASHLGMKPPNVSRDIAWLKKRRLLDIVDIDESGTRYNKKFFDAVVGLSEALMKKFGLADTGEKDD